MAFSQYRDLTSFIKCGTILKHLVAIGGIRDVTMCDQ